MYNALYDHYKFPHKYSRGLSIEMDFWDIIYCEAASCDGVFSLSMNELCELSGASRQSMWYWLHNALKSGELLECTPSVQKGSRLIEDELIETFDGTGRVYNFKIPNYDSLEYYFLKPRGKESF